MAAAKGLNIRLKASGEATAMTAEATTAVGNTVYVITNTAKRVIDPTATLTVLDGGVATVEPYTVNRLAGVITFDSAVARVITVTGHYLPMSTVAEAKEATVNCAAQLEADNAFGDADVTRIQVGKDFSASVTRWATADEYFVDVLEAGAVACLEVSIDAGNSVLLRAWVRPTSNSIAGGARSLIEESVGMEGAADADGRSHAFLY